MNPNEPADDLERELSLRPPLEPDATFRRRVLAAVRTELRRPTAMGVWRFVALSAATVLLVINFSMSVTNDADFRFGPTTDRGEMQATAARLRDLSPELSEDEALRHALVLRAAERTAVPQLHVSRTFSALDKEPK